MTSISLYQKQVSCKWLVPTRHWDIAKRTGLPSCNLQFWKDSTDFVWDKFRMLSNTLHQTLNQTILGKKLSQRCRLTSAEWKSFIMSGLRALHESFWHGRRIILGLLPLLLTQKHDKTKTLKLFKYKRLRGVEIYKQSKGKLSWQFSVFHLNQHPPHSFVANL